MNNQWGGKVLLSVIILACTGAFLVAISNGFWLSKKTSSVTIQAGTALTMKVLPGDESSGILLRELYVNSDNVKQEMHIKFSDGAKSVVYFDLLGRVVKVVETESSGDRYQVFNLNLKNGNFVSVQVFRKDNTLFKETKFTNNSQNIVKSDQSLSPLDRERFGVEAAIETIHYAEDGKTSVAFQKVVKGYIIAAVYFPGGISKKAIFFRKPGKSNDYREESQFFDEKGNVLYEETFDHAAFESNRRYAGNITYKRSGYRPDGTLWYTDSNKPDEKTLLTEFHPDGKTVFRSVSDIGYSETLKTNILLIEKFDQAGKLVQKRQVKGDFEVVKDEEIDGDGKITSTKEYKQGELEDADMRKVWMLCLEHDTSILDGYRGWFLDPNHLEDALNDVSK